MLGSIRCQRHRPWVRTLIIVLMGTWLSSSLTATCGTVVKRFHDTAPMALCAQEHPSPQPASDHASWPDDCFAQVCLDAQAADGQAMTQHLESILAGAWVASVLFFVLLLPSLSRPLAPPVDPSRHRRRIPLIYRFCTLLN